MSRRGNSVSSVNYTLDDEDADEYHNLTESSPTTRRSAHTHRRDTSDTRNHYDKAAQKYFEQYAQQESEYQDAIRASTAAAAAAEMSQLSVPEDDGNWQQGESPQQVDGTHDEHDAPPTTAYTPEVPSSSVDPNQSASLDENADSQPDAADAAQADETVGAVAAAADDSDQDDPEALLLLKNSTSLGSADFLEYAQKAQLAHRARHAAAHGVPSQAVPITISPKRKLPARPAFTTSSPLVPPGGNAKHQSWPAAPMTDPSAAGGKKRLPRIVTPKNPRHIFAGTTLDFSPEESPNTPTTTGGSVVTPAHATTKYGLPNPDLLSPNPAGGGDVARRLSASASAGQLSRASTSQPRMRKSHAWGSSGGVSANATTYVARPDPSNLFDDPLSLQERLMASKKTNRLHEQTIVQLRTENAKLKVDAKRKDREYSSVLRRKIGEGCDTPAGGLQLIKSERNLISGMLDKIAALEEQVESNSNERRALESHATELSHRLSAMQQSAAFFEAESKRLMDLLAKAKSHRDLSHFLRSASNHDLEAKSTASDVEQTLVDFHQAENRTLTATNKQLQSQVARHAKQESRWLQQEVEYIRHLKDSRQLIQLTFVENEHLRRELSVAHAALRSASNEISVKDGKLAAAAKEETTLAYQRNKLMRDLASTTTALNIKKEEYEKLASSHRIGGGGGGGGDGGARPRSAAGSPKTRSPSARPRSIKTPSPVRAPQATATPLRPYFDSAATTAITERRAPTTPPRQAVDDAAETTPATTATSQPPAPRIVIESAEEKSDADQSKRDEPAPPAATITTPEPTAATAATESTKPPSTGHVTVANPAPSSDAAPSPSTPSSPPAQAAPATTSSPAAAPDAKEEDNAEKDSTDAASTAESNSTPVAAAPIASSAATKVASRPSSALPAATPAAPAPAPAAPAAPPAISCDFCTNDATYECEECEGLFCDDCLEDLHRGARMMAHKKKKVGARANETTPDDTKAAAATTTTTPSKTDVAPVSSESAVAAHFASRAKPAASSSSRPSTARNPFRPQPLSARTNAASHAAKLCSLCFGHVASRHCDDGCGALCEECDQESHAHKPARDHRVRDLNNDADGAVAAASPPDVAKTAVVTPAAVAPADDADAEEDEIEASEEFLVVVEDAAGNTKQQQPPSARQEARSKSPMPPAADESSSSSEEEGYSEDEFSIADVE